jgi:subtilisin family serine protease
VRGRLTRVLTLGLGFLVAAASGSAQGAPPWVADELLVGIRAGVPRGHAEAAYRAAGAALRKEIPQIGVHRLRVAPAALEAVERALARRPEFAFVEKNRIFAPDAVPNDPYYGSQWHLPKIAAPGAWDISPGTANVVIAILDSGVDSTHQDLAGKLVPGINTYDDNTNTADVHGHGTKVAGTATAFGNNGVGVASVAWQSLLMPIRVTDTRGYALTSTLAEGLVYAVDNGAWVMNMSFAGVAGSATIRNAAQYVMERGGVVVAGSGNCGCFDSTADTPYILSVAATGSSDGLASFSSRGNYVDLAAPGVNILTTRRGGDYGYASGTSFSGPVVAGVAALMLSANPDLTPFDIISILETTADDLGAGGYDTSFGHGRVNAYQAILAAADISPDPPDTVAPTAAILSPSNGDTVSDFVVVNVSAADDVEVTAVELYLDGGLLETDTSAPFAFTWDTVPDSDGAHTLEVVAHDAADNSGVSPTLTVTVDNSVPEQVDDAAPSVTITSPTDGQQIAKIVKIGVTATDDVQVQKVEVYVDGSRIGWKSCSAGACSLRFNWRARRAAMGAHEISVRAYDTTGNIGTCAPVTVNKTR